MLLLLLPSCLRVEGVAHTLQSLPTEFSRNHFVWCFRWAVHSVEVSLEKKDRRPVFPLLTQRSCFWCQKKFGFVLALWCRSRPWARLSNPNCHDHQSTCKRRRPQNRFSVFAVKEFDKPARTSDLHLHNRLKARPQHHPPLVHSLAKALEARNHVESLPTRLLAA